MGTGALALGGAVTGFRTFASVCSVSDTLYYSIEAIDANGNPSGDWEVGLGTYSASNELTRTTPSASSSGGTAVNFGAGNKRVFISPIVAYYSLFSTATAASAAETTAGTSTVKFVTPDGLGGSDYCKVVISILVSDPNGSAITTGDGKAYYRVPAPMNGYNLVAVAAHVTTASSSGTPTIQINNVTQAADMLSTRITIDASEKDSSTASAAAVIDTNNDDVATADELRIDVDVAGTGTKGLIVEMTFQLP